MFNYLDVSMCFLVWTSSGVNNKCVLGLWYAPTYAKLVKLVKIVKLKKIVNLVKLANIVIQVSCRSKAG